MAADRPGTPVAGGTLQQSSFWHSVPFYLNELFWQLNFTVFNAGVTES